MAKCCFVFSLLFVIVCVTVSVKNEIDDKSMMDGKFLTKLGQSANEPLLQLIGRVLINTKRNIKSSAKSDTRLLRDYMCRAHQCSDWSEWSRCSSKSLYGVSERRRACGIASLLCPTTFTTPTTEKETKLCKGQCPANFTLTDNGFCLNYYDTKMNYGDAIALCQKEGGYVVNINSQNKADDTITLIENTRSRATYWMNGEREDRYSPWNVTYETGDDGFSNWYSSEPGNSDFCRVEDGDNSWQWFGRPCTNEYYVVCEIIIDN